MLKLFAILAMALAAVLLVACDAANLAEIHPGVTTSDQVLQLMGEPGSRHANADGTTTWEYTRQPSGVDCYMISFDGRQIVSRVEQVLSDEYFARVQPGMSQAEVRRLLGAPGTRRVFARQQEEIWEWRIRGVPATDETYFSVAFDTGSGLVKSAAQRVQMRN